MGFERMKMKNNNRITPIIFKNSPISDLDDDIFGFHTQAIILKEAVKNGAAIIGIIGDYGSGKSSLTEISQRVFRFNYKKNKINLWDTFSNNEDSKNPDVHTLSRSFLYQFAQNNSQWNSNFARYINERQSKNYGKLSITMSSRWALFWFILAGIFFILFFTLTNNDIFQAGIGHFKEMSWDKFLFLFNTLKPFSYLIFFIGMIFVYMGIKIGAFVFSLWDSQGKISPESGDIFEIFTRVINHLLGFPYIHRKRIIYIEDLDRIDNKALVILFLKELGRFVNILPLRQKKKIVFIVSLKSEASMQEKEDDGKAENIYSKIFDYTLWIKPIHYENIADIVYELLKKHQEKIENILGGEKLSRSILIDLKWILTGENLTIREIKDRLNELFILYQTLKTRDFENSSVKINKCSAVVFLHRAHAKEYEVLLKAEKKLAQLIRNCYIYRGHNKDLIKKEISELSNELKLNDSLEFIECISDMIFNADIDEDFMMYFYNHPTSSYIKNLDEKEISDYILHPAENFKEDAKLEERIIRVINDKKGKVIKDSIHEIKERNMEMSEIVFEYEAMFCFVLLTNESIILNGMQDLVRKILNKPANDCILIGKILHYNFDITIKNKIIGIISSTIHDELLEKDVSEIIDIRTNLIKTTGEYIAKLINLFVSEKLPIITKDELQLINSNEAKINLININRIDANNYVYILNELADLKLNKNEYVIAENVFLKTKTLSKFPNIQNILLKFLTKNSSYNEQLFTLVLNNINTEDEKSQLYLYLQVIDLTLLSHDQLNSINELDLTIITDEKIITFFEEKNLFKSALLSRIAIEKLDDFDFKGKGLIKELLESLKAIYQEHPKEFLLIRFLLFKHLHNHFTELHELFQNNFPVIQNCELELIEDIIPELYEYIDYDKIDNTNYETLSNYCTLKKLSQDKLFSFLNCLFGKKDEFGKEKNSISDPAMVKGILSSINFVNISFNSMSDEQKNTVCEMLSSVYSLETPSGSIQFMELVNCLVPSLEEIVLQGIENREIEYSSFIGLLNNIQKPSRYTLEVVKKGVIDQGVSSPITEWLYSNKCYEHYIIGKALTEKTVSIDENIPSDIYYQAFINSVGFRSLCLDNKDILLLFSRNNLLDEKLPDDVIPYFYQIRQPIFLVKFVLDKLQNKNEEIKNYLFNITHLDTEKDAEDFLNLITSDKYIGLLSDKKLFYWIYHKMWNKVLKQKLTTKTNRELKPDPKFSFREAGDYDIEE
jgi:hypothetical protein